MPNVLHGQTRRGDPVPMRIRKDGTIPIRVTVNLWQFAAALAINDVILVAAMIIVRSFYG